MEVEPFKNKAWLATPTMHLSIWSSNGMSKASLILILKGVISNEPKFVDSRSKYIRCCCF